MLLRYITILKCWFYYFYKYEIIYFEKWSLLYKDILVSDEIYAIPTSNGGRSAPSTPPNLKRELSILKHSGSLKIGPGKHVSYESKTTNGEVWFL